MTNSDSITLRKPARIVLLEDESLLADLYEMCIRDWFKDVEIVKFTDGDAAWRELLRAEPDMLIMDWNHPGLNGHEILDQLAAKKAGYVILLTSELFSSEMKPAFSRDLKLCYLPKPFGIVQFWQALNDHIGPSDFPDHQALLSPQPVH
jgi:DNA-binding response OmpR family regulator